MNLLAALRESGRLRAVDLALADTLHRLDPATPDAVLAAAALASFAVSQGDAGLALSAAPPLPQGDAVFAWPEPEAWRAVLAASPWVLQPAPDEAADPARPLVLEGPPGTPGMLYLRRYREYERRLAARLRAIVAGDAQSPSGDPVPPTLVPLFAALFPDGDDDRQADAARLAISRRLALVTGGPGTGKTSTIARMLLLALAQARADGRAVPRIALAAPTGRAAERMAESLREAVANLSKRGDIDASLCAALPQRAQTLHRLLGPIPGKPGFRHHSGHRLPYDLVVVDEASMVDLPLMCKLVEAVADDARLVLLGDRDQLPSVEAGDVLAAIVDAAADEGALRGHRVHLERGWRQADTLDIAPLADAVRHGADPDARERAVALLRGGALPGVRFHEGLADPLRDPAFDSLLSHWRALQSAADPAAALDGVARARLLVALREGPQGARALNRRIEDRLAGPRHEPYFHGRLLLVVENSYAHGLFNGDIGVCLDDADGRPVAWFPGDDPAHPRAFHPAALPAHESAFAMTVHKAQGSEFDRVWLLLPARDNRVLSRELVYTGITRARSELHVAAGAAVLEAALAHHASRVSGLGWRLGAGTG